MILLLVLVQVLLTVAACTAVAHRTAKRIERREYARRYLPPIITKRTPQNAIWYAADGGRYVRAGDKWEEVTK